MTGEYPKIYLYKRIVQAKLFIDSNYGEKIDLNNISNEASFSRFHFIRLFKSIYGFTPHQYLVRVRMVHAKKLLEKGSAISDVCFEVGFDSLTSFTGLFKRYNHISPSQYRKEVLERQKKMRTQPLGFVPSCFAEKKGWLKKSNFQEVK